MKFKLLIDTEIVKIIGNFRFKTSKQIIYPANRCSNANNCNIYERDKSHAQLSLSLKNVLYSRGR